MALITSKRYPEFYTYIGKVHHTTIKYQINIISGLNVLGSRIITDAIEGEIYKEGGKILEASVYCDYSWWGIIPTFTITTEFKWYLPGETFGVEPLSVTAIIIAIVAVLAIIFGFYYTKRYFDVVEKHGYPPWYESIFGKVALVLVAGAGAYAIYKFTPYLYQKIYKGK